MERQRSPRAQAAPQARADDALAASFVQPVLTSDTCSAAMLEPCAPRRCRLSVDPTWPQRFEAERALSSRSSSRGSRAGSTTSARRPSPASPERPIVDMIAGVRDLEVARAAYAPLLGAAYHSTPHRPHRAPLLEAVTRSSGVRRSLHLTEPGSDLGASGSVPGRRAGGSVSRRGVRGAETRLAAEHGAGVGGYTVGRRDFVASRPGPSGLEPACVRPWTAEAPASATSPASTRRAGPRRMRGGHHRGDEHAPSQTTRPASWRAASTQPDLWSTTTPGRPGGLARACPRLACARR